MIEFLKKYFLAILFPILIGMTSVKPGDAVSNFRAWFYIDIPALIDRKYASYLTIAALIYLLYRLVKQIVVNHRPGITISFLVTLFSIATTVLLLAGSSDAVQGNRCELGNGFELYKTSSSWTVTYAKKVAYVFDAKELHGLFGSNPVELDCGGIIHGDDYFAIRSGWKHDLVSAFGVTKFLGIPTGIQRMYFDAHDGSMNFDVGKHSFLVLFGDQGDLRARFCWNQDGSDLWSHNKDTRHDTPPFACVSTAWPFVYPVSGSTPVTGPEKGQYAARSLLSLFGVYSINGEAVPWNGK